MDEYQYMNVLLLYTLVLNKCHDVNHIVKREWLCNTMKLAIDYILVVATIAAGLIATICGAIEDTTPRLPFVSSVIR